MSKKVTTTTVGCSYCVYIGPTILGVLQSGTIFKESRNVVLEMYASVIEKHPRVARLIVDGDKLADARAKVKKPGTLEYIDYHKALTTNN